MSESHIPIWLEAAHWSYSQVELERAQPVSVFDAIDRGVVNSETSGVLRLRLEPRFRYSPVARVLNADGREAGVIRSEGLIPGANYTMRRAGKLVWTLSIRSIVRRRHVLTLADGDGMDLSHAVLFNAVERRDPGRPKVDRRCRSGGVHLANGDRAGKEYD